MPTEFHASLQSDLQARLRELESRSQRRELVEVSGVNLCSNDYLGLADDLELKECALEAMRAAPSIGSTGSRLLSGHFAIWNELEEEFARFTGAGAALYFGSGYAGNLGLLTSLAGKDDVIFSDALNHASLIDGIRLSGAHKVIYPHRDLNVLEDALRQHQHIPGRKFIVTESVFSMDGDVAPVFDIADLAARYGAGVIVDEAHATAVHGPGGKGVAALLLASGRVIATMHTCGKALASAGAFVCGSSVLREYLLNSARSFIFSTAMPPYLAGQIRASLRRAAGMHAERAELSSRSAQFAASLRSMGYKKIENPTQIIPLVLGENETALGAAQFLRKEGFAVRAIRPPTVPKGAARLRFSLTHKILDEDLSRLANAIHSWRSQHAERPALTAMASGA